jgi:putative DNA-invertase from lambdoid prophage Rac
MFTGISDRRYKKTQAYMLTGRLEMKIYGYVRVSTDRQADEGESLGTQQRTIEGYAMMQGMTLSEIFVERGVSGSKALGERPEGARLLAVLQAGDAVITPKLDRMFRSALNALDVLGQLQRRGVNLHMIDLGGDVTGNGISKLVFTILSAVAEAERDRIRDVKADQRKRERYLGGIVPFGWQVGHDGELVEVPAEQAAIRRMTDLRQEGRSLRAISEAMKGEGINLSHVGVKGVISAGGRARRAPWSN